MKYSILTIPMFFRSLHTYMQDKDIEAFRTRYDEMMRDIACAGYHFADVMDIETHLLSREFIRETYAKYGLSVGCYLHMQDFFAGNAERCVEDALYYKAPVLMLVPVYKEEYESMSSEEIHARFAGDYIPVLKEAKRKGLRVVIEDTPDLRVRLCRRDELDDLLSKMDGLEVVYDSGNMILAGEEPVDYFKYFSGKTAYIHLKDMASRETDKGAVIGKGLIDLQEVAKAIKESGYDGTMAIEFVAEKDKDLRLSLRNTLEYVKNFFR